MSSRSVVAVLLLLLIRTNLRVVSVQGVLKTSRLARLEQPKFVDSSPHLHRVGWCEKQRVRVLACWTCTVNVNGQEDFLLAGEWRLEHRARHFSAVVGHKHALSSDQLGVSGCPKARPEEFVGSVLAAWKLWQVLIAIWVETDRVDCLVGAAASRRRDDAGNVMFEAVGGHDWGTHSSANDGSLGQSLTGGHGACVGSGPELSCFELSWVE